MRIIGITGGVGSGKSAVLSYIANKYNCKVILADEVAHKVKEPGEKCYTRLIELLSDEILEADGTINKAKMADKIFSSEELLEKVNAIIHPAVKEYIVAMIKEEKEKGKLDYLFIEAALLIEDGYIEIVDEMWYIYASEKVRRERLRTTRHYSDEKINAIMEKQLSEEEFRKHCKVVIDNGGNLENTYQQIDRKLGDDTWQKEKNIQDN